MRLSIFTDASVDHRSETAGFAFYIGCKEGKIQKAGKLKVETKKSHVPELHCIANALYTLLHSKFAGVTSVYIYTDSQISINAISLENRTFKRDEIANVVTEIDFLMMEICLKYGKSIRSVKTFFKLNHVRAHTYNTDKLSVINNWCDENAKKYMRLAVKEKNKKSIKT